MKVTGKILKAGLNKVNAEMQIALYKSVESMKTDIIMRQVMPFDTSTMQNESMHSDASKIKAGKVKLTVNGPYARRMYFHPEYNFKTDKNPNAKGQWFEDYITGPKKMFLSNAFKTFMKGRL